MKLDQKTVNGLSLLGIALTAIGISSITPGWGKWCLIIAAVGLVILGSNEVYRK